MSFEELERERAYADGMVAAAAYWMRKARQAQRTIALVVHAAGGKVTLHQEDMLECRRLVLETFQVPADMSVQFRTRRDTQS